ncbi:MAG: hypothetical protein WDZ89_03405 [Gemmatimonadota bacterium]
MIQDPGFERQAASSRDALQRLLSAFLLFVTVLPAALQAQTATARVEENFRAEPNGVLLGQVLPGTELRSPRVEGQWMSVTLEGWMWTQSLQARPEGGVVVSTPEGENLRDAPSGRVAARLGRGTELEELERVPGWIRVRRSGWIWAPSMTIAESSVSSRVATANVAAPAPPSGAATSSRWLRAGERGAAILSTPDGDTLATSVDGAELRLLSREGNWGRVQMEGWVWLPHMATDEASDGAVASGLTAAELTRDPERYRSRLVELDLQFISLERAEKVRTDFHEGEPFLLTRGAGGGFVYVALPADRLADVGGLLPLERITVIGRVRTGSAGITGSPILDLVELRTERDRARAPER